MLFTLAMLPLSEAAKNIGFGVSLALYLGLLLYDRQRPAVPLVGLGLFGLLGATVLSALASEYPYHSARGVWEVFRHVSFFFIVLRAFRLDGDIRRFVAAITAGTGVGSLIVFYQFFMVGMPIFSFLSLGGKHGSAQFLVMVLFLLLSVLATVQLVPRDRLPLVAAVPVLLIVLGLTDARTLWLGFIFVGLALAVWLRRWVIAAAVTGLVLLVALVTIHDERVRERVRDLSNPGRFLQFTGRVPLWQKSLNMWKDHPWLGVGPRAFKVEKEPSKDPHRRRYGIEVWAGQAHNLWVHTAAEMGTVGLLALLGWVASVVVFLWRLRGVKGGLWFRALWVGTVGAFCLIMIAGVTDTAFGYEHALLLNAELGLLAAAAPSGAGSESPARQSPTVEA